MTNSNSKGKVNYAARMRAIRPYVDFNHDLRVPLNSAAKAQITRYYTYIQKLTVRPHQIYRTKSKKRLQEVQRFAQHDKHHGHIKVAFVPNAGEERMKIVVGKDGKVHARSSHISIYEIPLDPELLIERGAEYIQEAIDAGPRVKTYAIQAGEFEIPGAYAKQFIVREVLVRMERYGADMYDADNPNSHYFGNWLHGLNGYTFHNQKDLGKYREQKRQLSKKAAREHVNTNRREKRIQANPPGFWVNHKLRQCKLDKPPQPKGWVQTRSSREYYRLIYQEDYKEIKTNF